MNFGLRVDYFVCMRFLCLVSVTKSCNKILHNFKAVSRKLSVAGSLLNSTELGNSLRPSFQYMLQWNMSTLVQILACRLDGAKPVSGRLLVNLNTITYFDEILFEFQIFSISGKCISKCQESGSLNVLNTRAIITLSHKWRIILRSRRVAGFATWIWPLAVCMLVNPVLL